MRATCVRQDAFASFGLQWASVAAWPTCLPFVVSARACKCLAITQGVLHKNGGGVCMERSNLVARGNSDTELSSIMGEACCTPSHVWLRKGGFIKYSATGCHAPAVRALDAHMWVGTQWRTGVIHATQQNVPRWVVRLGTMLGQGGESRASKGSGRCRVGHGGVHSVAPSFSLG